MKNLGMWCTDKAGARKISADEYTRSQRDHARHYCSKTEANPATKEALYPEQSRLLPPAAAGHP